MHVPAHTHHNGQEEHKRKKKEESNIHSRLEESKLLLQLHSVSRS